MMVDIPHFPIINSQCEPKDIITLMSNLFCIYDRLIDIHGCYKVLSIMDCYFVISGVPKPVADHTDRILNLALGFMMEAKQLIVPKLNLPVLVNNPFLFLDYSLILGSHHCSQWSCCCGCTWKNQDPIWSHGRNCQRHKEIIDARRTWQNSGHKFGENVSF